VEHDTIYSGRKSTDISEKFCSLISEKNSLNSSLYLFDWPGSTSDITNL
jgi:hypothetical protein